MEESGRGLTVIFVLWCVLVLLGYNEKRTDPASRAESDSHC